ncbi:uncharacterized protein BDW47DRAFT_29150 [Aspergillus candidus]|uniref:Uncharacterized protein n=1 Tax=Aspergillus candidus TaxID=41067 RepID=A0A2I2FBY1_ASPCN|nr:hypothetical protein BDW47DRAFT_29150 [Aspergillus candidus]PLB38139.1 hypothetical protein BDW47DRAFT_29150 [Aspergillus candidus]
MPPTSLPYIERCRTGSSNIRELHSSNISEQWHQETPVRIKTSSGDGSPDPRPEALLTSSGAASVPSFCAAGRVSVSKSPPPSPGTLDTSNTKYTGNCSPSSSPKSRLPSPQNSGSRQISRWNIFAARARGSLIQKPCISCRCGWNQDQGAGPRRAACGDQLPARLAGRASASPNAGHHLGHGR